MTSVGTETMSGPTEMESVLSDMETLPTSTDTRSNLSRNEIARNARDAHLAADDPDLDAR